MAATRAALGWTHPPFEIPPRSTPPGTRATAARASSRLAKRFARYRAAHPELAAEFTRRMPGELPANWASRGAAFIAAQAAKGETVATRKASQQAIEALAPQLPELIGGSADLTGSVFTELVGQRAGLAGRDAGNYVNFGVREFGMSAIANGIALHGGFIPYVGTFLTFSDYARNALRMAALMKLRTIFVYTHDSIGLGEDGPTHQSVEHAASLRLDSAAWTSGGPATPSRPRWRGWRRSSAPARPGAACCSRARTCRSRRATRRRSRRSGAAATCWPTGARDGPRAVVIATGSEVALAMGAREALADEGIAVRVVSMPCTSVFDPQDAEYRASVLPPGVPRVAVEAGATDGWRRYVGAADDPRAAVVGSTRFGESAPAGVLFKHFGITVEGVVAAVRRVAA